jgi:(R)-2-hydroxyacyl-CoA dehydratese activating ATPase
LQARHPVRLSTVCTVFVESDILAYLAHGKKVEDILAGVHGAIAARTVALMRRVGVEPEITFTGGVSRNVGIVHALEERLDARMNIGPDAHFMGALGAALFALDRALSGVDRPAAAAA